MICMSPIAPLGETACASPALSARITARIHDAGTPKRREASAMKAAKGSVAGVPASGVVTGAGSALATPSASTMNDVITATTQAATVMRHALGPHITRRDLTGKEEGVGMDAGDEAAAQG